MALFQNGLALKEKSLQEYLSNRLITLKGRDLKAFESEFKEWIHEGSDAEKKVWTIPDLTDKQLRNFFLRAIAQIN